MEKKKFYITTAIDYVNSLPHVGTAYEKISADCIARAKRLLGYDVRFCMGTDEHSINVKKKAVENGQSPIEYCNGMVPQFEKVWKELEISYDDFIRTTQKRHIDSVQELFRKISATGDIYKAVYNGWYCEGCEAFIQEKDLVEGKCPNHMKEPAWIQEENYFFKLSKYAGPLLEHICNNPGFIQPESRRNEIVSLIKSGLDDISVSRSGFDWGIPLPDDTGHVVYVWFDALINYISALGYGEENKELFEKYWPADLHIIGKDITRFHCVIWPSMLMSAGIPLPKTVFGHGFIYHRGEKMSKSLGNVVSPLDVVEKYGADPLRYFMLREVAYGQDGDFTFERFIERYNSDLANDLGNLVSRTITMIEKYCDSKIPSQDAGKSDFSMKIDDVTGRWTESMERYDLSGACSAVFEYIREANRYIETKAPWNLAKDPGKKSELESVLGDLACVCVNSAVLLYPYMPSSSEKIFEAFGCAGSFGSITVKPGMGNLVEPGTIAFKKDSLFPRIQKTEGTVTTEGELGTKKISTKEDKVKMTGETGPEKVQENAVNETSGTAAEKAPENDIVSDIISIEDFAKVHLRVGEIKSAETVKGSDKLLKLGVDDGTRVRTIFAGMAKHFSPEEMVGRRIIFIANLKPRKMMGDFSEGMVLAAVDGDTFSLLTTTAPVSPGTKVS